MKKLIFGVIAIVLFALHGNAQENNDYTQKVEIKGGTLKTYINNELTEYKYKSLVDFNEGFDIAIKGFDFNNAEYRRLDKCEVTITVTLELSVGAATGSISASITTTCANAAAAAKKLKAILAASIAG